MDMKKDFEFYHLKNFKDAYPLFPNGKIIKNEKPDFLIKNDNKIIGIEHTVLYKVPDPGNLTAQSGLI